MKGLLVNVYRSKGFNCTKGVSSYSDTLLLVGEGVPEISEYDRDQALKLVRRNIFGREHIHAEPIEPSSQNRMFGGNFIYSSDGRFPSSYPIPVHDREEGNYYGID